MPLLVSVNVGTAMRIPDYERATGIDKRPTARPVEVRAPGPKGIGASGLVGDDVCDLQHHGGDDQAVYAYAMEDLSMWAAELGTPLSAGAFGENLTTQGMNVTDALIGERWQIGDQLVLEVAGPRVPCRTFATWLRAKGWVKTFTAKAVPGAYLRVVVPGQIRVGDPIQVVHRPNHDVTINLVFRAVTTSRELLPRLLVADALPEEVRRQAEKRELFVLDDA